MKRSLPLVVVLVCAVAAGAFLLLPKAVDASCYGLCERVQGGQLFCRECVSADQPTGVLCQQSGPCHCFYIQCAYALQSSVDSFTTPDDVPEFMLAELDTAEQTPVPADPEDCTLTAQIFGDWVGPTAD